MQEINELIKKEIRIKGVNDYKNGKLYIVINDYDPTDVDYIFELNYSDVSRFLSNNLGAGNELKIGKTLYLYSVDGINIALKSKSNEVVLMPDYIKVKGDSFDVMFDANLKRSLENLNLSNKEEIISLVNEKENTLRLIK